MRYLLTALALVVCVAATPAHFVFVYVAEGTAEARLVFGHTAAPDPSANSARCEKTVLMARDASGKESKLTVEKGDGNFYRAKLPANKPVVVFGTTEAGVTQRGEMPPMLTWYYPKAVVGDPFASSGTVGTLPLEIVPVKEGENVRFRVVAKGKPVAGLEVTIGLPGVEEDKMPVVKTDSDGLTPSYAERGQYCVAVRNLDNTPGESGGKKYASVRHIATVVIDFRPTK